MFQTLRGKLLALYLGIVLFGFGGLTIWAAVQMANAAYDDFGQNIRVGALQLSNQLVEPLDDGQPGQLDAILTAAAQIHQGQVALFDSVGTLVLTSDGESAELITLESYTYQNDADGQRMAFSAEPINYEGQSLGSVQIAASASTPRATAMQRISALIAGFVLISVAGLAACLWAVSKMIAPLSMLQEKALSMSRGNLSERVEVASRDEIGEVGSAFNEMAIRVEAMINEQRTFASNASHELRTPLTTVQLRAEALQGNLNDPELTHEYAAEIESEVKHMGRLVDDLMLLSRLDAKRLDAGTEVIDVERLMQILKREQAPIAQAKSQTYTLHLPDEPIAPIQAHANHLRIVIGNIIGNAIKYTPPDGAISVSVSQEPMHVRFTVADNGVGISADDLPHIGNRFFRADKAHARSTAGTGLGLALVQSIVDLYDGEFKLESDGIGVGTTVTVLWPKAE